MFSLELLNSAENVLDILFVWTEAPQKAMGLTEISRATNINKSTVYKILQSLQRRNMISLDPTTKKYSLDHGVLELSSVFLRQLDIKNVAHPWIERLAEESGKTITLALKKDQHLVFIDRVDGCENVRFYCDIGKVTYYNGGAAAKAVFANLTDAEQQLLIAQQPSQSFTRYTKGWEQVLAEVPQIRQNGYSISDEEVDEGVFAVGAPIFDTQGRVVAGMAMATLKYKLSQEKVEEMGRRVLETSRIISQKMGYSRA